MNHRIANLRLWLVMIQLVLINATSGDNFGPYKQVYPKADLQLDPRNCSTSDNGTCPLYIALMMAFDGDFVSSGAIPGIQVAIDEINNDSSMLPGYTLHYTLMATRCETYGTTALDALYTELLQPPTKLGIIGSGCSLATEPTAQISHYYNITHISCSSASEELSNRTRFRNYFQLLPTDADLAFGFFGIIMRFKWKYVAIILQEERLFQVTMNRLVRMLKEDNELIMIKVDRFLSSEGISGLGDQPFDPEYRIFILAMYADYARRLLCEASNHGVYYPRNEFLLFGWYGQQWWIGSEEEEAMLQVLYGNSCTIADRERVIGPALAPIVEEYISNCSKEVDSGINGYKFQANYEEKFEESTSPPLNLQSQTLFAQQCYDATWVLARALDHTIRDINNNTVLQDSLKAYEPELNVPRYDFNLQHFSYKNFGILNLTIGHINTTNYIGLTGNIYFNLSNGLRTVDKSIIYQYQPTDTPESTPCSSQIPQSRLTIGRTIIGSVNHKNLSLKLFVDEDSLWSAGVPYDGEPEIEILIVHPGLTALVFILTAAGATFATLCMIFNFVYRNRKLIRLSSPKLNNIIGAGAIVLYIDVCFFVIPSTDQISSSVCCNITPWLTAIGYSLCYGTIIAKLFRVFYIIHNPFTTKRNLKDLKLALGVAVLVLIDVLILLIYTIVEGLRGSLKAILVQNEENSSTEIGVRGIIHLHKFYACDSMNRDITLGILLGYKTILQIVAFALTFSIQKVKLKGLNDAKYIAVAVYITNSVMAIDFVTFYLLKGFLNLYAALFSLSTLFGTTAILALIFIPKMIGLYRDPHGKTLFKGHTIESSSNGSPSASQGTSLRNHHMEQIENLRRRIRELESFINQPQQTSTESSCEKELQAESCFTHQDKDTSDKLSERECSPGEEPITNDDVESIERPPPRDEGGLEQGIIISRKISDVMYVNSDINRGTM